jgi:hypothetical protein
MESRYWWILKRCLFCFFVNIPYKNFFFLQLVIRLSGLLDSVPIIGNILLLDWRNTNYPNWSSLNLFSSNPILFNQATFSTYSNLLGKMVKKWNTLSLPISLWPSLLLIGQATKSDATQEWMLELNICIQCPNILITWIRVHWLGERKINFSSWLRILSIVSHKRNLVTWQYGSGCWNAFLSHSEQSGFEGFFGWQVQTGGISSILFWWSVITLRRNK